jgi:hypothetical protein
MERSYSGIHAQQAARLQELVEFIQSQVFTMIEWDSSHLIVKFDFS